MPNTCLDLPSHPTDKFVHWVEKNPLDLKRKLRGAYDRIVEAGLEGDLHILLNAAQHAAVLNELETRAGEDI